MSVNLATFPGAPDGMVRAVPQHELEDTQAWTIIDAFLNQPGFITRRAGLANPVHTQSGAYSIGLIGTKDPSGTWVGLELVRKTSGPSGAVVGFKNSSMDEAWAYTPNISPHEFFDAKDALGGGVVIGTASDFGKNPSHQAVVIWRGAAKGTTSAASLASDISRGDTTVSLSSGGSDFCSGHWLMNDLDELIGVVESVSGNTLTLENKALIFADHTARTVKGIPFKGISPRASKGRITTATDSTTVNGGDTLFKKQGLDSGTWDLYKTNWTWIGTVSSVTSDSQLELTTDAAVSMLNDDYIAIKRGGSTSPTAASVGWINANFAGHQFYAKGNHVAFSDDDDPEALYVNAPDADTFAVSSDPVTALLPATDSLIICSEKEAFALTGAIGTTPDRWGDTRVHDDGCISTMTGVTYKGGVIWAGRRGVWYWNGGSPVNIVGSLGEEYQRIASGLASTARMWGMVHNDHYFLFVENTSGSSILRVPAASTDGSTSTVQRMTIVVNLQTSAVSILRNVGIRGKAKPPASSGDGETYFSITTSSPSAAVIFKASGLFAENSSVGADAYTCLNITTAGPEFFVETKKYDLGNPQLLKLFKMLLLHFRLWGTVNTQTDVDNAVADSLRFATVKGLDSTAELSAQKLYVKPGSGGTWQDKRIRFMKKSQYLALRIFQGTTTITALQLGAWAIGFKQKRPGRV